MKKLLLFALLIFIVAAYFLYGKNDNRSAKTRKSETNVNTNPTAEKSTQTTDWLSYYADNGVKLTEVDADVLYEYGEFYSDTHIITAITVEDKLSNSLKVKTGNNDSFFFSIVANFNDKSELASIEENSIVVIAGFVEKPSSVGSSVILDDCHIIYTGDEAAEKAATYRSEKAVQIALAKALQQQAEEAEILAKENEKAQYIDNCEEVKYSDVERNPDSYEGLHIKVDGKVVQVAEGFFDSVTLRVEKGKNTWYVTYYREANESRILEGDMVVIYGECTGVSTYTSVLGNSVTIPSLKAKYIDIK